jgi:predicted aconitase
MKLTREEQEMLDGRKGRATQKAMDLLVRYAEALGAERFVDTRNVAGVPGSANPFLQNYYKGKGAEGLDAIFSHFDLDSDELVDVPPAVVPTYHLQGGADPGGWQTLGVRVEVFRNYEERERFAAEHDVGILKTCTPYLAGNVPARGEHLAWMESSAVIYANSVLGARTNTEGRESTSAAMLTGKIPDWGLHRTENRHGTHRIDVNVGVDSVMDWGMLGYYVGDVVQERIPVVTGRYSTPEIVRLKHFGAAASSSGGVEMYHIVGVTPEEAGRDVRVRQGRTAARVRSTQCERDRSERGLRDARLPARGHRPAQGSGAATGRQEGQCQLRPLDLHVTRSQEPGARRRYPVNAQ